MDLTILPPAESPSSPAQALRILFSYPYVNLVPQLFSRTRDYVLELEFVDRCRDILTIYISEIPEKEALFIEHNLTFLELHCLDHLNRWQEYLELFERVFREKRTRNYISKYDARGKTKQALSERFGRYLFGYDLFDCALVHSLYRLEHRRAIIERKLIRLEEGKSVEHLKRHQQEQLSSEELDRRYEEIKRLIKWFEKAADGG